MSESQEESKLCTTSGRPVDVVRADQTEKTGQHKDYIVLCEEERRKGFVRPYRESYRHVGIRPKHETRPLRAEEIANWNDGSPTDFVAYEPYPPDSEEAKEKGNAKGRYWTEEELKSGCGSTTSMGRSIAETYARNPKFYGATFCVNCNKHLPVAEFVWTDDGQRVGS